MKQTRGRVEFAVVPINDGMVGYLPLYYNMVGKLSEITEEQASELVDWVDENEHYVDYLDHGISDITAKESLVSLLKANDSWIKDWCNYKDFDKYIAKMQYFSDGIDFQNDAPDDFLIIKL